MLPLTLLTLALSSLVAAAPSARGSSSKIKMTTNERDVFDTAMTINDWAWDSATGWVASSADGVSTGWTSPLDVLPLNSPGPLEHPLHRLVCPWSPVPQRQGRCRPRRHRYQKHVSYLNHFKANLQYQHAVHQPCGQRHGVVWRLQAVCRHSAPQPRHLSGCHLCG